jgi:hypothetical protein
MLLSEAIHRFLRARQTPANADLVARWSAAMETQLNVSPSGEPVEGKRSTWTDGLNTWHSARIPKSAADTPEWEDYELRFPLEVYAEGIGMTGWDWTSRQSRWVGFDFDTITGHAQGIGITDSDLLRVRDAACALPYVEVRRSTGGAGLHLYVYFDGVPTANHTEHAALARCVLGMMSAEVSFDFPSQIDACGHVMWIWHRKMTAEAHGLEIVKPATRSLTATDLPANWRDHIEVVRGRRSKVRLRELTETAQDPFEALTSSRTIVPLDAEHKRHVEALMGTGFSTLWVSDHHLLQTHTRALHRIHNELKLAGVFETISEGKDKGTPNCFLFPLSKGGWKVFRFSQGINEAETWTQSKDGWTTCHLNRLPDLATACKTLGGVETENGGYVFRRAADAQSAATLLGGTIDISAEHQHRRATLRAHKDGRLVVHLDREKGDTPLPGWVEGRSTWTRIYSIRTEQEEDSTIGSPEIDNVIRHVETASGDGDGWVIRKNGGWGREPYQHARLVLQNLGYGKTEAEQILGGGVISPWRLVNLPFHDEYPGGRQWNREAAQFRFAPADCDNPVHPHWDAVIDHFFGGLTPTLEKLPWAVDAGIRTGGDWGRAWIASVFRFPYEPLPYIFAYGPENGGKSTLHEGLSELVTKGIVMADRALTTKGDFNGELANAILCVVEEKQVSKHAGAMNKIKDWVTCRRLSIRKMRTDSFEQDSTLHWLQCSNYFHACPVFPGDTRVTVIEVPPLSGAEIPKPKLMDYLRDEGPHFLRTLMNLELPAAQGRLRIPPVETSDKQDLAGDMAPVSQFLADCCEFGNDFRVIKKHLQSAYNVWALENNFEDLSSIRFGEQLMAVSNNKIRAKGQQKDKDGKMKHCYEGVRLKGVTA